MMADLHQLATRVTADFGQRVAATAARQGVRIFTRSAGPNVELYTPHRQRQLAARILVAEVEAWRNERIEQHPRNVGSRAIPNDPSSSTDGSALPAASASRTRKRSPRMPLIYAGSV